MYFKNRIIFLVIANIFLWHPAFFHPGNVLGGSNPVEKRPESSVLVPLEEHPVIITREAEEEPLSDSSSHAIKQPLELASNSNKPNEEGQVAESQSTAVTTPLSHLVAAASMQSATAITTSGPLAALLPSPRQSNSAHAESSLSNSVTPESMQQVIVVAALANSRYPAESSSPTEPSGNYCSNELCSEFEETCQCEKDKTALIKTKKSKTTKTLTKNLQGTSTKRKPVHKKKKVQGKKQTTSDETQPINGTE